MIADWIGGAREAVRFEDDNVSAIAIPFRPDPSCPLAVLTATIVTAGESLRQTRAHCDVLIMFTMYHTRHVVTLPSALV
ncbi:hypothetical protein H257_18432 [Aphanomyces astaci]|uniref:Uncharacterized protein n=1 Tax=Aphanomyces astaci TaxID=112090 RepID=W4FDF0_APHAT|nr:hypothetical protein H257_18432 [Aphanomyces astaci]ETV64748.1 hypothetical protein H257_18432 [Aphanomyces astaci]|eukprot:XP_009845788.1 hypothetical protein H257_18432 [Aphanomyces astaci]